MYGLFWVCGYGRCLGPDLEKLKNNQHKTGLMLFDISWYRRFKCFQHKEMIDIGNNQYTNYPDLIISLCIHVLKYHMVPHKYVSIIMCQLKKDSLKWNLVIYS